MAKKITNRPQGFGESQIPTRAVKRFIIALSKQEGDQHTVFLEANLEKLDESLLDALPLVFKDLTQGKDSQTRGGIAGLFVNLGGLLQQFPRGTRWLNVELSIKACTLALQVFTQKAFPENWAMTQMNVGCAYLQRIRGERAENLEEAIVAYDRALQIYTREAFPEDWAGTQMNLGIAYRTRIRGERAENLEEAIVAYDRALQIYTREAFPENWARVQHNLADVYRNRIQGDIAVNIEQAIALYNQAAEIFSQTAYPHLWFRNQAHLAAAYLTQASLRASTPEQLADLNTAITLLRAVLATADPHAPTPDYIDAQYQLGNALTQHHALTQDPADLHQALAAYTVALNAISPEHYDREKMWQALPETQTILGSRLVQQGEWKQGLALLQAALHQLSPHSLQNARAYANALYQVGRTHEIMSNWKDARIYYHDALRFYEHIQDEPGIARTHHGLGAVLGCQGAITKSSEELAKARSLYQNLNMTDELAEIEELAALAQKGQQEDEALNLRISA